MITDIKIISILYNMIRTEFLHILVSAVKSNVDEFSRCQTNDSHSQSYCQLHRSRNSCHIVDRELIIDDHSCHYYSDSIELRKQLIDH